MTDSPLFGTFTWPETTGGESAHELCKNKTELYASRDCLKTGEWITSDFKSCSESKGYNSIIFCTSIRSKLSYA